MTQHAKALSIAEKCIGECFGVRDYVFRRSITKSQEQLVSIESNKTLIQRYIDEVWNDRQPAASFFTPHYQRHLTASSPALTAAEQQQRVRDFQAAFPDLHFTIEDMVAEGDRVVFRATMRGTHRGVFREIVPTDRQIAITVLDVVRVEGNLFAEQWGGLDLFDLLQQLGAVMSVAQH